MQDGTCLGQCLGGLLWSVGVGGGVVLVMIYGAEWSGLPYCNYLFTFNAGFTRVLCIAFLAAELAACLLYYCVLKVRSPLARVKVDRRRVRLSCRGRV